MRFIKTIAVCGVLACFLLLALPSWMAYRSRLPRFLTPLQSAFKLAEAQRRLDIARAFTPQPSEIELELELELELEHSRVDSLKLQQQLEVNKKQIDAVRELLHMLPESNVPNAMPPGSRPRSFNGTTFYIVPLA